MSKTARTDGRWQVDCDLNGVPICIGQPLSLPRYDLPTLDEVRVQCTPLVSAIKSEWRTDHVEDLRAMVPCAVCAVGYATLQRDASGHYRACEACGSDYAGADELALRRGHVVDADKMVRPCRCGGCADSGCPGRGEG